MVNFGKFSSTNTVIFYRFFPPNCTSKQVYLTRERWSLNRARRGEMGGVLARRKIETWNLAPRLSCWNRLNVYGWTGTAPLSRWRYLLSIAAETGGLDLAISWQSSLSLDEKSSKQRQVPEVPKSFSFFKSANMREIVHIQAGQCGNQIGAKVRIVQ